MHEQSQTIMGPGRLWFNIFGRGTGNAGTQLPGTPAYPNLDSAERGAIQRSQSEHNPFEDPMAVQRYWERSYQPPVQQFNPSPPPMRQRPNAMARRNMHDSDTDASRSLDELSQLAAYRDMVERNSRSAFGSTNEHQNELYQLFLDLMWNQIK